MYSGKRTKVIGYRSFNVSFLGGGATQEIILANALRVERDDFLTLETRIHDVSITDGYFQVTARGVDPDPRDGRDFVTTELVLTSKILGTTPAGSLFSTAPLTDLQYPMIRVGLTATQGTGGASLYAQLSVDLVAHRSVA